MKMRFLILLLVFACSQKPDSPELATVNGEPVLLVDFRKALDMEEWKFGMEVGLTEKRLQQLKTRVLDSLLKDRLLLQEADKRKIAVSDAEVGESLDRVRKSYPNRGDFEKLLQSRGIKLEDFRGERLKELRIRKLMESVAQEQLLLTEERLKKYYDEHRADFHHPDQVRARQIVTDSEEKAESVRALLEGGMSFEEVAGKYSLSPDRKKGGDLGWFGRGEMPVEFEQACFRLKANTLSPVVKTPYGFHLFEVLEKRGAGQLPFDAVREAILAKIAETEGRAAFQKWYETLRSQAKITVKTELLEGN